MKLSLLFTSLIALSVAAPSPEAAPEAEGAAVAGGRYHHSGYRTDKCGNREGSQYGQMRIQYGDEHNRVRQHDVPVFCGGGDGVVVDMQNVRWVRTGGGRVQGNPACQVKYYPHGSNQARYSHVGRDATYLSRHSVYVQKVHCNI